MLPTGFSNSVKKQKLHKTRLPLAKGAGDYLDVGSNKSFSKNLAKVLNDPQAEYLQCPVSRTKRCDCIGKFIFYGTAWKDTATSKSFFCECPPDNFTSTQLDRAKELLNIVHVATELRKEKCYDTNDSEGKSVKELRGVIGLGNGRKRSKRYEEYVLITRKKIRESFSLCEKAAQKLLGYSTNFLYKKLQTNPEKTSRIVATNKTKQISQNPKHLYSIEQLQEKAQSGEEQCCTRFCIRNLMVNNRHKVMEWRKKLDGCTQRVAQEIIAEVLQAADSMDGPKSFCQNVVHWITGCSFKKIRRIREHLKKNPESLPEHGLKKYWKNKVQKQTPPHENRAYTKDEKITFSESVQTKFPTSFTSENFSSNFNNNNNNRSSGQLVYTDQLPSESIPNQFISYPVVSQSTSTYQHAAPTYDSASFTTYTQADPNMFMTPAPNVLAPSYNTDSADDSALIPNQNTLTDGYQAGIEAVQNSMENQVHFQTLNTVQSTEQVPLNSICCDMPNNNQICYAVAQQNVGVYQSPETAEVANESAQPYFLSTNNGNFSTESLYQSGLTPLLLAQAPDQMQVDQGSNWNSQFSGQPLFLFSPTGLSSSNGTKLDNLTQMVPVTPFQMHSGSSALNNSQIPSSVTPVAFMQPQGNVISGWLSAQHVVPSGQFSDGNEDLQNTDNALPVLMGTSFPNQNVVKPSSIEDSEKPKSDLACLTTVQPQVEKDENFDQATKLPQGAVVADRSKRFSRDRLGAIIDSPFIVSVFTPSLIGTTSKDPNSSTGENVSSSTLSQVNSKSIFTFPPAAHSLKAAAQMPGTSSSDLKDKEVSHEKNKSGNHDQELTSFARYPRSIGSCGSIGNVPEDLLQNELFNSGLSNMPSLPILNLPSAGWANDATPTLFSQQHLPQHHQQRPEQIPQHQQIPSEQAPPCADQPSHHTDDAVSSSSQSASTNSESPTQPVEPPAKKKRKLTSVDNIKTKPNQKPIRFHNFTPSDFANGEVNVSQYKKPSEFVNSSGMSFNDMRGSKRNRKSLKNVPIVVAPEAAAAIATNKANEKNPNSELETYKLVHDVDPISTEFDSDSGLSKEIPISKLSTSNVVSMCPLQTPAVLKSVSPKFKIMVPSSTEHSSSLSTSLQLNTPLFVHSGALLTPSNKLNSAAFLYRVSPGQLSSNDKTTLQTPHFFNFSGAKFSYFLNSDGVDQQKQQQKQSESSESSSDSSATVPMNRNHMTLNLTQKSSTEDCLQTPSKIQVVTPSAVLPCVKITPDVPPDFCFPMEKHSTSEANNSDYKQPEAPNSDGAELVKVCQPETKYNDSSSPAASITHENKEISGSQPPSIVVNTPDVKSNSSATFCAAEKPTATKSSLETSKQLVISLGDPTQSSYHTSLSSPLNTPALTQIITPTFATLAQASHSNFPNVAYSRPQSLYMTPTTSTSTTLSSSQISTPTFYQLVSPSQAAAPSPSLFFLPYPQKNMVSFPGGSLLSPAFGMTPRPNSGSADSSNLSLLKSILINQSGVFQFPPTSRAGGADLETSPEKEAILTSPSSEPDSSQEQTQNQSDDSAKKTDKQTSNGQDQDVFVVNDACLPKSAS